jgi:hypothetical protein
MGEFFSGAIGPVPPVYQPKEVDKRPTDREKPKQGERDRDDQGEEKEAVVNPHPDKGQNADWYA